MVMFVCDSFQKNCRKKKLKVVRDLGATWLEKEKKFIGAAEAFLYFASAER